MEEQERQNFEIHLERVRSIYRFQFFFAGLVFAVLAAAIQFPLRPPSPVWLRATEGLAWLTIGGSGYFALRELGGFTRAYNERELEKKHLSSRARQTMWFLFFGGVLALILAKITDSLVAG